MNRETTFWSVFTALALAALLALYAQEQGFFETDNDQTSPGENETSSPAQNASVTPNSTADSPDPLALECLDHSGLARHDHVTLEIFIDGNPSIHH